MKLVSLARWLLAAAFLAGLWACAGGRPKSYGVITLGGAGIPTMPYSASFIMAFEIPSGRVLKLHDTQTFLIPWDVDTVVTPDGEYALVPHVGGVEILRMKTGNIVGTFDMQGLVPQAGVDVVVLADSRRALVAAGGPEQPLLPYLASRLFVFSIPTGELLAEIPLEYNLLPWDADIRLTPNERYGLVAAAGAVTIFSLEDYRVTATVELPMAGAPQVAVDLVLSPDGATGLVAAGIPVVPPHPHLPAELLLFSVPSGAVIPTPDVPAPLLMTWEADIQVVDQFAVIPANPELLVLDLYEGTVVHRVDVGQSVPAPGTDVVVAGHLLAVPLTGAAVLVGEEVSPSLTSMTPFHPPPPYLPVELKFAQVLLDELDDAPPLQLPYPIIANNLDLVLSDDGCHAVLPAIGAIRILDLCSQELVSVIETQIGDLALTPQQGVDVALYKDVGVALLGGPVFPPLPYLVSKAVVFTHPSGDVWGEIDLGDYNLIPWDVDIAFTADGVGLITAAGGITIFELPTGNVLAQVDTNGMVPQVGADLALSNPYPLSPDPDEDFIIPWIMDKDIMPWYPQEEVKFTTLPERVTLNTPIAGETLLREMLQTLREAARLFTPQARHQEFLNRLDRALESLKQGDLVTFRSHISVAKTLAGESVKDPNVRRAILDALQDVWDWTQKPMTEMLNYQPLGEGYGWVFWYNRKTNMPVLVPLAAEATGAAAPSATPAQPTPAGQAPADTPTPTRAAATATSQPGAATPRPAPSPTPMAEGKVVWAGETVSLVCPVEAGWQCWATANESGEGSIEAWSGNPNAIDPLDVESYARLLVCFFPDVGEGFAAVIQRCGYLGPPPGGTRREVTVGGQKAELVEYRAEAGYLGQTVSGLIGTVVRDGTVFVIHAYGGPGSWEGFLPTVLQILASIEFAE